MSATQSSTTVAMPQLSDGMEDGTIISWLLAEGATVSAGEDLVEIETDKATSVYQAPLSGTLRQLAQEGETVPVGAPIATVGEDEGPGAAISSAPAPAGEPAAEEPRDPGPESPPSATLASVSHANGRLLASPLARRRAAAEQVDLAAVTGSGPRGRIGQRDVEAFLRDRSASAGTPSAETPNGAYQRDTTVVALTRGQVLTARRMSEAKSTIPDFQTTVEIDMEECRRLRESLKALDADGRGPSYNDLVIRACALSLREHPKLNASYEDENMVLHGRVNIGFAVAAADRLLAPVISDADRHDVLQIARTSRELAEQVRDETITPPQLGGGTFTVSNLGMLGVDRFVGLITPGQCAILAVGAVQPRAVVRDGRCEARLVMGATLSADHRIVYGADAARFLASLKHLLENPVALLVDLHGASAFPASI